MVFANNPVFGVILDSIILKLFTRIFHLPQRKYLALAVAIVATGGASVLISAIEEEKREHHGG